MPARPLAFVVTLIGMMMNRKVVTIDSIMTPDDGVVRGSDSHSLLGEWEIEGFADKSGTLTLTLVRKKNGA